LTSISPNLKKNLDRLSPTEKINYLNKQIADYENHMEKVYNNVEKMLKKIKEAKENNDDAEAKQIAIQANRAINFAQPYKDHLNLLKRILEKESTKLTHSWLDNARPVPKTMGRGLKKTRKGVKQKRRKTIKRRKRQKRQKRRKTRK
tara:strand:- start:5590 stop:6030 length:441 start_codon:yes stop_codon:yes gene_type:complete